MGDYRADVSERVGYHIYYMDLRSETFAISRHESGVSQYMAFHNNQRIDLGVQNDPSPVTMVAYVNSHFGYQGDERNYGTAETATNPDTGIVEDLYKVNTRLGQYTLDQTLPLFAPLPEEFGLEVSTISNMLISGKLTGGTTFNHLTGVPGKNLEIVLNRDLTGTTVLPIYVR